MEEGASNKKTFSGKSRLEQIVEWCGEDFAGVIAFDEVSVCRGVVA